MNATTIKAITGRGIPVRGDEIDTDRIIPARYLRCVTFDGLGEHAFEDDRKQDPDHAFNQERYAGASILVVGDNFGCGSSREHAPQILKERLERHGSELDLEYWVHRLRFPMLRKGEVQDLLASPRMKPKTLATKLLADRIGVEPKTLDNKL